MKALFASLAVAVGLSAAPASAAIVNVVYTGTVSSGYDSTGEFGAADVFLDGAAFQATLRFDKGRGALLRDAAQSSLYGGAVHGLPSPALGAWITINGATQAIGSDYLSLAYAFSSPSSSRIEHYQSAVGDYGAVYKNQFISFVVERPDGVFPNGIDEPLQRAFGPGDSAQGRFQIITYASPVFHIAGGYLTPETVSISVAAGVPEPATWAMMLIGFAGLGNAKGRRKVLDARELLRAPGRMTLAMPAAEAHS